MFEEQPVGPVLYEQGPRSGHSGRGAFGPTTTPMEFEAYPSRKDNSPVLQVAAKHRRGRPVFGLSEKAIVVLLTLLATTTKLYRIGRRSNVSWDEAHFGKFGAYYLNRTFYHDVHPPLAKMLVGFSEFLAGHNGTFNFKGGQAYPDYVNYRFMRVFNALFGISLTPMAYVTCRNLRMAVQFAALAALCVTFDNAICVMSRFILLDAPLLGFTALSLTMLVLFHRQRAQPFSRQWWKYIALTGFSLGLVSSAKWVGLFAVALVGFYTIAELYFMFCDTRLPPTVYAKHWMARIGALIVVPLLVYALCFKIHFVVLNRYNSSANFMPTGFQVKLRGNPIARQPYDIVSGSYVRLHSHVSGTGYLHSHEHKYPSGSMRQQVTGYVYADGNNYWQIERRVAADALKGSGEDAAESGDALEGPIGDGDVVFLRHNSTRAVLYSELAAKAPMSSELLEVSAAGGDGPEAQTPNALWRVEIVGPQKRMADGALHPLGTPFRLRNVAARCLLSATGERLSKDWGWGQAEIACASGADAGEPDGALWTVERHKNRNLTSVNLGAQMGSSFLADFARLNKQMWLTNNALVPNKDKHNILESDPITWPFMKYPMRMVGWDDHSIKYMEVGNPLLWWGSATACVLFPLQLLYWLVRHKRQCLGWRLSEFAEYLEGALMLWGGWALHYLPFFLMGRVTYLHHYLPALYFGILFLVYQASHFSRWYLSERSMARLVCASAVAVVLVFLWFSPLTYGWDRPIKELRGRKWAPSWPVYEDKYEL